MHHLEQPSDGATETYRRCAEAVRSNDKRDRMLSAETEVSDAADMYMDAAQRSCLYEVPQENDVAGTVTKDEMRSLYKTHMSRKEGVAREVYDRLMTAPSHQRCPLCGQRQVSTLDHYLPKSTYPVFAVFPHNLVPACSKCNMDKGTATPSDAEHQLMHPYFDNCESDRWLYADVIQISPPGLNFSVRPPENWSIRKVRRADYHFDLLKLNELYAIHAAEELVNIQRSLTFLYESGGSEEIQKHLQREAESRANVHKNSWQTATYEALASDDWFCDGGFLRGVTIR